MSRRLSLRPEAMAEIREAAEWYAERGLGLDDAFLDEVSRVLSLIRSAPRRYPFVDADFRKAVLRRFPYVVLYRADENTTICAPYRAGSSNSRSSWMTLRSASKTVTSAKS